MSPPLLSTVSAGHPPNGESTARFSQGESSIFWVCSSEASSSGDSGDDLGTVELGKLADLIVVGANPLDDINNVRQLKLVLKEGRIVSDKRTSTTRRSS